MSGTPYKKDKRPTLSAQFDDDVVKRFDATTKQMKRIRSDVIQELVRAFLDYTKDGRTPNFPLIVSAESYKDASGKTVVSGNAPEVTSEVKASINRIEAYTEEIARVIGADDVVKLSGREARAAASRSGGHAPAPPAPQESQRTEHRSPSGESPRTAARNKPGGRDEGSNDGA